MENNKLNLLKEKYGKIAILISVRDRPTELSLLLQSLRTSSYNDFNVYILDDCSGTPLINYHFFNCIVNLLKYEGHNVIIERTPVNLGVIKARQACVDLIINKGQGEQLFARVDDDCIIEPDYLLKLVETIDAGYDLVSGVTVPALSFPIIRETKFVEPIINEVKLNDKGNIILNCDDCGMLYDEEKILLTPHFRSCALYKREIHDKVNYDFNFTKYGFREEEIFSFKCILAGFKLAVNTKAINWHLVALSGGERSAEAGELTAINENILKDWTKNQYKKYGDFINEYYKKNKIMPIEKRTYSTNLIL